MVTFECNANYLRRVECYTELKSWGESGPKKWGIQGIDSTITKELGHKPPKKRWWLFS